MIYIDNVDVFGWEAAIRGMRNPMNSWDRSDSQWTFEDPETAVDPENPEMVYEIGKNDFELMKRLVKSGPDHSKFMRMINVTCDVIAPLYYWKEFKTYRNGRKFGDDEPDLIPSEIQEYDIEMNSTSTMHHIQAKEFTLDNFSHEHLYESSQEIMHGVIKELNVYRRLFNASKNKEYWWQMIQLLPSSYNQLRTIQLNYAVLRNMYHARKNHRLDEWRDFCKWIETLPYSELITME